MLLTSIMAISIFRDGLISWPFFFTALICASLGVLKDWRK
jgi:hypothetical protein